ncbi:hypothetical protein MLD52_19185 [Puniceicoccaceae bacterium K14]|nr:hypothetical protein [Puniceicoccaceae bacterium K14]
MFIVFLKFAENKANASQFMDGHKEWLRRGFDEDVFLMAGSLSTNSGGCILVHNTNLTELNDRVAMDPFVVEGVALAEFVEVDPSRVDERLRFLMN